LLFTKNETKIVIQYLYISHSMGQQAADKVLPVPASHWSCWSSIDQIYFI